MKRANGGAAPAQRTRRERHTHALGSVLLVVPGFAAVLTGLALALLIPQPDPSLAAAWFALALGAAALSLAALWRHARRIDGLAARLAAETRIEPGPRDAVGTLEAAFAAAERRLAAATRQGDPARRDDPETGLHNRQTAMRRGRDEITRARRNHHAMAVALISLDIGAPTEDPRRHGQQERALRLSAEIAMQALRAYDTVARWGHDTFLAIIPEAEIEHAVGAVERLRIMMAEAPSLRAGEVAPAVHGGVAVLQPDDATLAEIAARAERALERARSGVGAAVQAAPGPRQRPSHLTSV